jgi:prophage regulatory protein
LHASPATRTAAAPRAASVGALDPILPYEEVRPLTGNKDRATLWRWEQAGRFPKRIKTGPNSIGWKLSAVLAWQAEREAESVAA